MARHDRRRGPAAARARAWAALAVSGGAWAALAVPGGAWAALAVSGGAWAALGASGCGDDGASGAADAAGPDEGAGDVPDAADPGGPDDTAGADAGPDGGDDAADGGDDAADGGDGAADSGDDAADGGDDAADGGDADAGPPTLLAPVEGVVAVTERVGPDGSPSASEVRILFMDAPSPLQHAVAAVDGPCVYYERVAPVPCDPPCDLATEQCAPDGACVPWAKRLSAGTVTLGGLAEPVSVAPDDSGWYAVAQALPADLVAPGAAVAVAAAGDEVAAFEATVAGVGDMAAAWGGTLALDDGGDNVVTWTPQGDGATVELALQIGWHGAPPTDVIWCVADEAAGAVAVPQALVQRFPPAGGIGLFQHPSLLRRVSRALVPAAPGAVEVVVASERWFSLTH